ncbi:MAG: coproporphyrinogen III oxidase family protein [Coriobacteriia bacterium]|nr:coproporphyrinogen III oxidase family protein [Coriobacteriia bacterium]MBN2840203.1 coproporphyrinogen III oxidase family protein [Coriobacteriia bacterium]
MLSERVLTGALRVLNRGYMGQSPVEITRLPDPEPGRAYSLYLHVPFCERLCPYCSFNRFLYGEDRARDYFRSLRTELERSAEYGYDFGALYIGGGTPTILIDELCDTIDLARSLYPGIREVSAESSPNHVTDEAIDALKDRVQRFSVGVQSFDDDLLQQMARYDKYGCSEAVFERVCYAAGKFHSLNVDLIFNFPSQTRAMLERDIELVKQTGANQTTFYPLMASPKNRRELARTIGEVDYGREAEYYRMIVDGLAPDFEPASAWTFSREKGGMIDEYIVDYEEYVGLGSGAMSYLGGRIYNNTFSLDDYRERIADERTAVAKAGKPYSTLGRMRYRFVTELFGLRLDKEKFKRDFGVSIDRALALEMTFMKLAGGIAENSERWVTLTPRGRYLLLVMMRETLATSNDHRDHERELLPAHEKLLLNDTGAFPCGPPPERFCPAK